MSKINDDDFIIYGKICTKMSSFAIKLVHPPEYYIKLIKKEETEK